MTSLAEDHKSLKSSYKELRRKGSLGRKKINSLNEEKETLEKGKRRKYSELEDILERARRDELSNCVVSVRRDYDNRLDKLRSELSYVRKEYEDAIEGCSEESIYDEYKSKEDFTDEVTSAMSEVVEVIQNDVGKRFVDEYVSQLENKKKDIPKEEMMAYVDKFYDLRERFSSFNRNNSAGFSNKLEEGVKKFTEESLGNDAKKTALFAVILFILILFTSKILFLLYLGFLLYIVINNVIKGAIYSKTLVECKVVCDNISVLEDLIREDVSKEFERRQTEIEEKYKPTLKELEHGLGRLEKEKVEALEEARDTFEFDGSFVRSRFDNEIREIDNRIISIDKEIESIQDSNKEILDNLAQLNKKIEDSLGEVKDKYLNFKKVGDQTILDYTFLVDIDEEEKVPVFFNYPKNNSCVFLYEDEQDVSDFIRLMCAQLRMKLKPDCLRLQVWDKKKMGVDYFCLTTPKLESDSKPQFSVATTSALEDELLEVMHETLLSRFKIILRESSDLAGYNTKMMELESVPESYMFTFIIDPEQNLVNKEELLQIANGGPSVGIYTNYFIKLSELYKEYTDLLVRCGKSYTISRGKLDPKATQYVLESLLKVR